MKLSLNPHVRMLYPTPTDIYSDRRMSDSTTSESNSPATEPDLTLDPVRKPSLPGLDQLLEPVDPFGRRPSMISDLSLSNRRSQALSSYAFPAIALDGPPTTTTASAPPTTGSPYHIPHHDSSSPQFSTAVSWNSPVLTHLTHHHHHHHSPQSHPHHHLPPHDHHSVSPPASLLHSPKRRRSPATGAITPPSHSLDGSPQHRQHHHRQEVLPSAVAPSPTTPTATVPATPTSTQPSDPSQPVRRPRGKLPKHTTDLLKEWLHAHSDHPYPSEDEKRDLCNRTKLSMSQVSNWMINASLLLHIHTYICVCINPLFINQARRRILAPASKTQAAASVSSDPYRAALPRHIGSMYPSHMYAPQQPSTLLRRPPPPPQDTLRLYEAPTYYDPPRYQPQSHPIYPQDRRLSYPNSVPYSPPVSDFQPSYPTPRYFTSPADTL